MAEHMLFSVLIVYRECFPRHDIGSLPHVVKLLDEYLNTFSSRWTVAQACRSGFSRRALEYLAARDPNWTGGETAAKSAVARGYVHVLQWLNECFPERTLWNYKLPEQLRYTGASRGSLMDLALKVRPLPLHWRHTNHNEGYTAHEAARVGRLEIIQWLHDNRKEGCSPMAMVDAARFGQFDIVKWLHTHYGQMCSKQAMDEAAAYGRLQIVQWLHAKCSKGCTTKAMDAAASIGQLGVVRFLHENRSEGCTNAAMIDAASHGHLDVVRYLYENRSENDLGEALSAAVRCDQCAVVEYLSALVHEKE